MKRALFIFSLLFLFSFVFGIKVYADEPYKSDLTDIIIESYPNKIVYGAFEKADLTGLKLKAIYADGTEQIISNDLIGIEYQNGECLKVGDKHVVISYEGKKAYLPLTVNPIEYDISDLMFSDITLVYNGRYQSYEKALPRVIGQDGIELKMIVVGGGVNAGKYDISIDFYSESNNYCIPESCTFSLTINPIPTEVVWENTEFVYDGKSKAPVGYYIDINGAKIYTTVTGASVNAGSSYTATALTSDSNYFLQNNQTVFEIKKADYDLSNVIWSEDEFVYDGNKKSVTLSGLPSGISVVGYISNTQKDAGKYTSIANLEWDRINYNPPETISHSWEIHPAKYDTSQFIFKSSSFVYDGNIHYPNLVGSMPKGADGIILEYTFSCGAVHVNEGVVSVIISFKTESKNYVVPDSIYSSVSITPKGINVNWSNLELIYNGKKQIPFATAKECELKIGGEAVSVGKYIAKAESKNSDYYIINDTQNYSIVKAINKWTIYPSSMDCFEGGEIKLKGESLFGNLIFSFYSDADCKNKIPAPTEIGTYYTVISVEETNNYTGLKSNAICFNILEVRPISFGAEVSKEALVAFNHISSDDFLCYLINNDGSNTPVDSSCVDILYQNGSNLTVNDSIITLKYNGYTLNLPIRVSKASYDLSKVKWENTNTVYNASSQLPTLTGLPEGVTILSYSTDGYVNAGKYTVDVVLNYDKINYNEPVIESCTFVINKKTVDIPYIKYTYNGQYIIPESRSDLYVLVDRKKQCDVGMYAITAVLSDSKNYVFLATDGIYANGIFEIVPALVEIEILPSYLHLFEDFTETEYRVIRGGIFNNDNINITFFEEDNLVFAKSSNPNYSLIFNPGEIVYLPYPTVEAGFKILLAVAMFSLLVVLIVIAIRRRGDIEKMFAIVHCRWVHRNIVLPKPKEEDGDPLDYEIIKKDMMEDKNIFTRSTFEDIDIKVIDIDVDKEKADTLISDSLAKSLIKKEGDIIYTEGCGRATVDLGLINDAFLPNDKVDVNLLKKKMIVSKDVSIIRIKAEGKIDKPLMIYANEFSLSAVKMIALSGGQAIKCITLKGRPKEEKA